jgi:hypothetical protein
MAAGMHTAIGVEFRPRDVPTLDLDAKIARYWRECVARLEMTPQPL